MDMILPAVSAVIAVVLGIFATLIALLQELEKRRKKKKEPALQDRISELTKSLESSVAVIAEIEEEISKHKNLEAEIERLTRLKESLEEIDQDKQEAIAQTLEIPIKKESRKSFWLNLITSFFIAAAFFAIGYFIGGK